MRTVCALALLLASHGVERTPLADIGPAPATILVDSSGKPFDLISLRGKVVLVSFVYTTCNGVCPATTSALVQVQKRLEQTNLWGLSVEFVSITLDPIRDTPEVLTGYARRSRADLAKWHFLTGPKADVDLVVAAWGMWARVGPSGAIDHPSRIFLIDRHGRQREIYNLEFLTPDTVIQDVRGLVAETARR